MFMLRWMDISPEPLVWDLRVRLVMELPVRAVSVLLAQMALVPQVPPDRLDMVLLVRNLVFAVLSQLVALLVRPVMALLDKMVQQVPMVMVVAVLVLKVVVRLDRQDTELLDRNLEFAGLPPSVALRGHPVMVLLDKTEQWAPMVMVVVVSVLKVVERLDMATVLLVRTAMVRVLPDGMPGFVVWQFLRMVPAVLPVDAAQNRWFRKRSAGYMVRRMRPCVPVLLVPVVFVRGMPAVRMVVMMRLWVLLMDRIGIRPVGFLRSKWRVDSPVWLA